MCFAAPASTIDGSSPGVTLCSRRYAYFSCVLLYDNRYVVGSFFVGGAPTSSGIITQRLILL